MMEYTTSASAFIKCNYSLSMVGTVKKSFTFFFFNSFLRVDWTDENREHNSSKFMPLKVESIYFKEEY